MTLAMRDRVNIHNISRRGRPYQLPSSSRLGLRYFSWTDLPFPGLWEGAQVATTFASTTPGLRGPRCIGGHLVRYPWSVTSDWAWYRILWYQTEGRSPTLYRYRNEVLSDIQYPTFPSLRRSIVAERYSAGLLSCSRGAGSKPTGVNEFL